MKRKKNLSNKWLCLISLIVLLTCYGTYAHSKELSVDVSDSYQQSSYEVRGSVKDYRGDPLPGVSIVVKGTNTGVITDLNGDFTIRVSGKESILVFSYIGFFNTRDTC